ncbi:MAG: GNAT family N-acetyltransferase [Atopobiaceae bacterium]|nr:GNAT family N-acetyltransferase [Atopobiaceae bacterium]MBR1830499.1 GNAT family N-acetyltransferase [Atopobiaceae bacterium]
MHIRRSTEQDFERIMEIYARARRFMAQTGNPNQWGPNQWPPADLIHQDIAMGKGYVCEHNAQVVGVFFFDQGYRVEPTYDHIDDGQWVGDETYGVVHRIASDGSVKGTGRFCLEWAFDQCGHLRIDTHGDNVVMQNLLRKLDFVHCGTIYVHEDNDPRLAFEKLS